MEVIKELYLRLTAHPGHQVTKEEYELVKPTGYTIFGGERKINGCSSCKTGFYNHIKQLLNIEPTTPKPMEIKAPDYPNIANVLNKAFATNNLRNLPNGAIYKALKIEWEKIFGKTDLLLNAYDMYQHLVTYLALKTKDPEIVAIAIDWQSFKNEQARELLASLDVEVFAINGDGEVIKEGEEEQPQKQKRTRRVK